MQEQDGLGNSYEVTYTDATVIDFYHQEKLDDDIAQYARQLELIDREVQADEDGYGQPDEYEGKQAFGELGWFQYQHLSADEKATKGKEIRLKLEELTRLPTPNSDPLRLKLKVSREAMRWKTAARHYALVFLTETAGRPDVYRWIPERRTLMTEGGSLDGSVKAKIRIDWKFEIDNPKNWTTTHHTVEFATGQETAELTAERPDPHRTVYPDLTITNVQWIDGGHGELTAGITGVTESGSYGEGMGYRDAQYSSYFEGHQPSDN